MNARKTARLKFAGLLILICVLAAVIATNYEFYRQEHEGGNTGWGGLFLYYLPSFLIVGVITPLIIHMGKRFPLEKGRYIGAFLIHLAGSVVFSSLHWVMEMVFRFMISGETVFLGYIGTYIVKATFNPTFILTYWVILAAGMAIQYRRLLNEKELHSMRLSQSLLSARLSSLKSQLRPHFLFNTLQTISVLSSRGEKEKVGEIIERLGKLIRMSLDDSDNRYVTLERELELVDCYLGIEEVRFSDRLEVVKEIDQNSKQIMVPVLLLQPLVENAIKHGFSRSLESGAITIRSRVDKDRLLLEILDDGKGFPLESDTSPNGGFGLKSVRTRLDLLYNENYRLELRNLEPVGAGVFLNIPCAPPDCDIPALS